MLLYLSFYCCCFFTLLKAFTLWFDFQGGILVLGRFYLPYRLRSVFRASSLAFFLQLDRDVILSLICFSASFLLGFPAGSLSDFSIGFATSLSLVTPYGNTSASFLRLSNGVVLSCPEILRRLLFCILSIFFMLVLDIHDCHAAPQ